MMAMLQRCCAKPSPEGAIHGLDSAEAAGASYLLGGEMSAFHEPACRFQAQGFDMFAGAHANLGLEQSAEVPFGQVGQQSEFGDAQVLGEVLWKP